MRWHALGRQAWAASCSAEATVLRIGTAVGEFPIASYEAAAYSGNADEARIARVAAGPAVVGIIELVYAAAIAVGFADLAYARSAIAGAARCCAAGLWTSAAGIGICAIVATSVVGDGDD